MKLPRGTSNKAAGMDNACGDRRTLTLPRKLIQGERSNRRYDTVRIAT